MNEGNRQNCANSPWVQAANRFIRNRGTNTVQRARVATVEFLLENGHCGINNRTSIDSILGHLGQQNIHMSREQFQNQVLVELKRERIVATLVYPGPRGGVFIPCAEDDIRQVATQLISRIIQELTNLEGVTRQTRSHNTVTSLRQQAELAKRRI